MESVFEPCVTPNHTTQGVLLKGPAQGSVVQACAAYPLALALSSTETTWQRAVPPLLMGQFKLPAPAPSLLNTMRCHSG